MKIMYIKYFFWKTDTLLTKILRITEKIQKTFENAIFWTKF